MEALSSAEQMIQLHPSYALGYGFKAQAQLALGDFEGALESATKSFELQSASATNQVIPLQMMASAQMSLKQFADVVATTDQILKTNPKNKVALEIRARALAALGQTEQSTKVHSHLSQEILRQLFIKTRTLIAQKKYEEAVLTLRQILAKDPLNPYAMGLLTTAYIQLNRLDDALITLEQEIDFNPQNFVAQGLRVRILLIQYKKQEALKAAEELDARDPYKPFYVASALIEVKRYKDALDVLQTAPAQTMDILWKRAQAAFLLGDRQAARAALVQIIQKSDTVDYRALATLLKIESEGAGVAESLGQRIVSTLHDSQRINLMETTFALEGKNIWDYVPGIPMIPVSKSIRNAFWSGVHNLPVDGQTYRATR